MKIDRALIGALLIGILVLSPSAYAITISVGGDAGGFTENFNAGDKDSVYGSTVIAANSLSHSIKGSGSLKESHWVSNSAGASAGVGVEIRKAESYKYGYTLTPGIGSHWLASRYPAVSASETLDVVNANYINAYANSFNAKGESAGVSTVLVDPGRKASLAGYSNTAAVSPDKVVAIQNAVSASAPGGSIQTEAGSQLSQLRIFPLELRMEKTGASTTVKAGYVNGYIDKAAVLNHEIAVSQQDIDSASGKQINSQTKSTFHSATLFNGLRMFDAEASTMTFGSLTGYDGISKVSKDLVEALQSGHVVGTFTSTATADSASKTRSSNYGREYDLNMQAKKDASGSSATGVLGYYVDSDDLVANKIQGAVDASESGDTINVAGGTYYENVQIDKSLSIKGDVGSDPSAETVVDGQMSGSVFAIGKNDPHIEVSLQGMTIQNGSGTYMEMWPDYPPVQFGGGVWNQGTLSIVSSQVSGNTAGYGSGIWTTGNLTVESSLIEGNGKPLDGGGIWNSGNLMVDRSTITGNEAYWNGGGIWNSGNMLVERSNVSGNTAYDSGGGIANDMGQATVKDSTISGNNAAGGGGGVYNIFGTVSLEDSNVSWNNGNAGGGVLNNGEMMVSGGSVSNNNAANGGGVFNMGTMELKRTLVDKNAATENGGGIFNTGMATISDSTIAGNRAVVFSGGIFNAGTTEITNCIVSDNYVGQWGGGISNDNGATLTIRDSIIARNRGGSGAGGIYNEGNASIAHCTISDNWGNSGGGIHNGNAGRGMLKVVNSTISNNYAQYYGGGIENFAIASVTDSSIFGNTGYYGGGGIFNGGGGYDCKISITGSKIFENSAPANLNGGGILNFGGTLLPVPFDQSQVYDNTPDNISPPP